MERREKTHRVDFTCERCEGTGELITHKGKEYPGNATVEPDGGGSIHECPCQAKVNTLTRREKTHHQERVELFMRQAGQKIPERPIVPSEEVRLLRARLILEEALETIFALGFEIDFVESANYLDKALLRKTGQPNLTGIADGCADLSVVTIGTLSACGISDNNLLLEVDRSNLNKFSGDAHKDEYGKWIKPSDWKPPAIKEELERQCQR